jgi:PAS domain S-box-containing protein
MKSPPQQVVQTAGASTDADRRDAPELRPPARWSIYLLAAGITLATFVLRWALSRSMENIPVLTLFVIPIAISAYVGGFGPGMLAAVLSAALGAMTLRPPNPYGIGLGGVAIMIATLLVVGSLISLFTEALHVSRRRLQASNNLLAITLASIGDAVITTDIEGRITFFNHEAERITGVGRDEAVGRPLGQVVRTIDEQTRKPMEDLVQRVLHADEVMALPAQILLVASDGRETPVDDSAAPIRDGDGPARGIALVFRDRSLKSQAENAQRERLELQQRLTKIAATAPGVIHEFLLRPDGATSIPYASPKIEHLYGVPPETLRNSLDPIAHLFDPDDAKRIKREVAEATASMKPWRSEFRFRHPTRGEIWIEGHSTPEREPDGSVRWYGFLNDITERKTAEASLVRAQERLQAALRAGGLGTWEWDLTASRAIWDQGVDALLGRKFDGTAEQAVEFFLSCVHPDDVPELHRAMAASLAGADLNVEYRFVRPDGAIRWIAGRGTLQREPETGRLRMVGACVDITAHKQLEAELERAKEAAEASNRAKDYFLAMVSHELRTPLTPVLLLASGVERDPSVPVQLREEISVIRANAEAEARLIDDLLDLTRIAFGKFSLERIVADVHEQLRRAADVCREELDSRRQTLVMDLSAAHAHVSGDPQRLLQVFWNLLQNASKYTSDGGRITIRTLNQPRREVRAGAGASAVGVDALPASDEQREVLVIEVQDNGVGIPAEALPRIFDPFEQPHRTLQNGVGGIGLGLTITKAIVEAHHGALLVASGGANQGATFTVRFVTAPAVQHVPEPPPQPRPLEPASPRMRVLLVEDHLVTQRNLQKLMQTEGYEVHAARDIASASALLASEKFDILLTDLGLPDGDGSLLMNQIRAAGLPMRGIVLSGYGMESDIQRTRKAGFDAHLIKPVTAEQLLDALAEVRAKMPMTQ